ncbi:alpha/beta fold hydrolase [Neobacillus jeddahensis]|uniref:alpha/beta fold hydrolase n=1 Tax=Neobacillus jeddahensis TaxID=1461580 RepID=UPI00058CF45F|nr:alpha/beta hydrolase [Neobacillus jeddahensis]
MDTKSITLQGATLTYQDKGKGSPIILLHGFCGSSRYWDKVIPELAKHYRVIAPDLPGHGGTSDDLAVDSIEEIADLLDALMEELKIDKVTVFGHSLGGYITLAFAEKYSHRLNGFSLIHSTAHPDTDEAKKGRTANVAKVRKDGIKPLIDGLIPKLFSPKHLGTDYVLTAQEIGNETTKKGAMQTLVAMRDRLDRNEILKTTTLPVLLIAGDQDQIIPADKTFSVSKENIQQVIIKNSGHMSMFENPNELTKVIKDSLSITAELD